MDHCTSCVVVVVVVVAVVVVVIIVVVVVVVKIMGFSNNPHGAAPQNLQKSGDFRRTRTEPHPKTCKNQGIFEEPARSRTPKLVKIVKISLKSV